MAQKIKSKFRNRAALAYTYVQMYVTLQISKLVTLEEVLSSDQRLLIQKSSLFYHCLRRNCLKRAKKGRNEGSSKPTSLSS